MARRFTIDLDDMEAATVELIAADEGVTPGALLRHLVRTPEFRKLALLSQWSAKDDPRSQKEAAARRHLLLLGLHPETLRQEAHDRARQRREAGQAGTNRACG